jgi:rhamnosyltransferase
MKRGATAIIGSRDIPATYGGFETVAEIIVPKFAELGWEVFVTCEASTRPDRPATYKGVNLFYFSIRPLHRIVCERLYDIYSPIRSSFLSDCIYMLAYGTGLFFFIPRIFREPLVVSVDGFE